MSHILKEKEPEALDLEQDLSVNNNTANDDNYTQITTKEEPENKSRVTIILIAYSVATIATIIKTVAWYVLLLHTYRPYIYDY